MACRTSQRNDCCCKDKAAREGEYYEGKVGWGGCMREKLVGDGTWDTPFTLIGLTFCILAVLTGIVVIKFISVFDTYRRDRDEQS